jgi:SAM-dependent methyltransferase
MNEVIPISQHDLEIQRNAEVWRKKPLLRQAYSAYYGEIRRQLAPAEIGPRLELGSGLGAIKEFIPDCTTSDLFSNPWLDRVENAYAISYPDSSLGSIILFDVWHHLQYPGTALAEFHRVLRPGGRLVIFDPATSLLGRIVYGLFHHEPIGKGDAITWYAPASFDPSAQHYYAAQGNCWQLFSRGVLPPKMENWRLCRVQLESALAYVATGGFSSRQLYSANLYPALRRLECRLNRFPRLFATRMLVALEKPVIAQ